MSDPPNNSSQRIDWSDVRERLERARLSFDELNRPSPERTRAILDRRAHQLAGSTVDIDAAKEHIEVIAFAVGGSRYAIETQYVFEIVTLERPPVPVPGTARHFAGVVNHRGEIMAVASFGSLFNGVPGTNSSRTALVVGNQRAELGLLVDRVEVVSALVADKLEAPEAPTTESAGNLRGVYPDGLIVLNGAKLLSDSRLMVDEGGRLDALVDRPAGVEAAIEG